MIDAAESKLLDDDAQRGGCVADALSQADDLKARARREIAALQATIAELDALRAEIERHRAADQGRSQTWQLH